MSEKGDAVEAQADSPATPKIHDRLTVVETVYHQPVGEAATAVVSQFSRELRSSEQVYKRKKIATEQWERLDSGWIRECGMLVLVNDENPRSLRTHPTPEEQAEIDARVLELGCDVVSEVKTVVPLWLVPPGESLRGFPTGVEWYVRCRSGKAHYTLNLFPA